MLYDIETLFIDRVLDKEHFYEKSCRKYAPKVSPDSFCHCMQEIILKIRYFERGLSKSLKKVNFIFSFEPSHF